MFNGCEAVGSVWDCHESDLIQSTAKKVIGTVCNKQQPFLISEESSVMFWNNTN